MPRFSLKLFLFVVPLLTMCLAFAYWNYAGYESSIGMSANLRGKQNPYAGYRLVVLHQEASSQPRVIAIEKNHVPPTHAELEPSFCRLKISSSRAQIYINGKLIVPTEELVAYFAESGQSPTRVVLDRDKYQKITQGGLMPSWLDQKLWDLCVASVPNN